MKCSCHREAPVVTVISTALAIRSRSKIFTSSSSNLLPLSTVGGTLGANVKYQIRRVFGVMPGRLLGRQLDINVTLGRSRVTVTSAMDEIQKLSDSKEISTSSEACFSVFPEIVVKYRCWTFLGV
jgi:hypothetical protein